MLRSVEFTPMDMVYDVTRLLSRLFSVTPNGIDRIDFALAEHFLHGEGQRFGALATGLSPRLFPDDVSLAAVRAIGAHWGEDIVAEDDPAYRDVVAGILGESGTSSAALSPKTEYRIIRGREDRMRRAISFLRQNGLPRGRSPVRHLPAGSRYLNVSQFPLWIKSYFDWLDQRRDVKAIFFIHDLLPLSIPEHFRSGEFERHRRRIANLARLGSAAIVTSEVVRSELIAALRDLGRSDLPIFAAPIPAAATFQTPRQRDPRLVNHPYFVCCSTIEPRKNHLLLLDIWRELVRRDRATAPKLVLVGARGWKYEAFVSALEESPQLRDYIIEIAGLTSPGLKRLLDNACALLMPSFAEGYGLPVREALATGLAVVASDIPAFREIHDDRLQLFSPTKRQAWLEAIQLLSQQPSNRDIADHQTPIGQSWPGYFSRLETFIDAI